MESNQIDIYEEEIELNKMLSEIMENFMTEILKSKKDLKILLETGLTNREDMIISDETRLQKILENLIGNSVKFTDILTSIKSGGVINSRCLKFE